VMSEQWPVKTLDELINQGLITLGRGKVISRKDLAVTPGTYPVYSSAKQNEGKFGEYGLYMFDEELITWSVDGGGRLFHRRKHKFSVTNVGGTMRINDTNRLNYKFLYYCLSLLHSKIDFDWVKKAHPSIIRKLYNEIPIPPLEEQQLIVSIIDEAFVNTRVGKSHTLKKIRDGEELFQSIQHSILFPENNNYEQTTIEESCSYRNGKAHEKDIHENGKYIVVNSKYISRDGTIKKYTNNLICPLHIDEIAMVLSDVPNGKALAKCILIEQEEKYSLNQRICAISSEQFIPKYLFFQLNRNRHFLSFNNGENQTNLRKNQVVSCPLFKPSIDEQISILEKLESLTEAYLLHKQKLLQEEECFINLEKSILQEAFSGKLTGGITA
jgi:restriction endonuclease S subunit